MTAGLARRTLHLSPAQAVAFEKEELRGVWLKKGISHGFSLLPLKTHRVFALGILKCFSGCPVLSHSHVVKRQLLSIASPRNWILGVQNRTRRPTKQLLRRGEVKDGREIVVRKNGQVC